MLANSKSLTKQFAPCRIASAGWWAAEDETTDADLVENVAAGDTAALQVLYARHNEKIYRYARRLVCNAALAQHLVTETFFEAWHQAWAFDGHSRVSTWLLGIARSKALIARPFTTLSWARGEIVDLVYYHRQSIDDVAEIMHLPRSAVKARMRTTSILQNSDSRNSVFST